MEDTSKGWATPVFDNISKAGAAPVFDDTSKGRAAPVFAWRIDVLDTGCGIAEAHFDRIFEEFVQLGNPERDRSKGLGLGLAIVKRIAGLLGCEVSVASKLGRGSRFSVTIPRMAEDAAHAPAAELEESTAESPEIAGALIVVIDDERDIRDALESLLTRWGAFVVTATSEHDALQKLEKEERLPDLLICDLLLCRCHQRYRCHRQLAPAA